jgi:NAD(P)-dependent dehydrogenase (short-subunit alcohol dehydrogenase family)
MLTGRTDLQKNGTRTCVITGAASGLGLETAKQLAASGLRIIGVEREPGLCRGAEEKIRALRPRAGVRYIAGDLSSLAGIRRTAAAVRGHLPGGRLDRLIHGATAVTDEYTGTEDGYELQFAVNYLAAFLLTTELFPCLIRPPEARVITISSGSHRRTSIAWDDPMFRRRYSGLRAYRQSKLALVLFTLELNRRVALRFPVRGIGIEPGRLDPLVARRAAANPSGRTAISVADAATAVARLAAAPPASVMADYWRLGRPVEPSPYARNAEAAVRLWRLSENLCGAAFL